MFVSFLGRSTRESEELIALGTFASTEAFSNVRSYRARRFTQLVDVEQSARRAVEQLIDVIDDRASRIENSERSHAR